MTVAPGNGQLVSFLECPVCLPLPNHVPRHADDEYSTGALESVWREKSGTTNDWSLEEILRCPRCGTLYWHAASYEWDNSPTPSDTSELLRLVPSRAEKLLEKHRPEALSDYAADAQVQLRLMADALGRAASLDATDEQVAYLVSFVLDRWITSERRDLVQALLGHADGRVARLAAEGTAPVKRPRRPRRVVASSSPVVPARTDVVAQTVTPPAEKTSQPEEPVAPCDTCGGPLDFKGRAAAEHERLYACPRCQVLFVHDKYAADARAFFRTTEDRLNRVRRSRERTAKLREVVQRCPSCASYRLVAPPTWEGVDLRCEDCGQETQAIYAWVRTIFLSEDTEQVRRDVLLQVPIGTPLEQAQQRLEDLGFTCQRPSGEPILECVVEQVDWIETHVWRVVLALDEHSRVRDITQITFQ